GVIIMRAPVLELSGSIILLIIYGNKYFQTSRRYSSIYILFPLVLFLKLVVLIAVHYLMLRFYFRSYLCP
ncbi:hypothetical protein L9F63_012299, partial [Diploptera punctata]